jgi:rare lipoprotein A
MGSRVKVTNLANGKSVVVKINDRFAASSGRVIAVTERAAEELDFVKAGSAQVKVELVAEPKR